MRLTGLWSALLDLVYPPRCVVGGCGRLGTWLCASCRADVRPVPSPRCRQCGLPSRSARCGRCQRRPPAFARATAAGCYSGVLRDAVHALKYGPRPVLAPPLGRMAAQAAGRLPADALVVAVPSHRSRVAERGIDHARRLAVAVAEAAERPLGAPEQLTRVRATAQQVGQRPDERRRNVAGAFRARAGLGGRLIVLVDDVLTTGATADAAAGTLRAAGARAVWVVTVARTLRPGSVGRGSAASL